MVQRTQMRKIGEAFYRAILLALGFEEAELMTKFGYPTQRLFLPGAKKAKNVEPFPSPVC